MSTFSDTSPHQSYPSHQWTQGVYPPPHTSLTPAIKGPRQSLTPTTLCQCYPSHQRTQEVTYTHHHTPVLPQPSKDSGGQLHPPPHASLTPAIKGPKGSLTPTTLCQSYPSHQAKDPGGHLWTAVVSVGRGSVCSWHPWCGCCATPASCSSWSPSLCWVAATWWCACCGPHSTHGPAHPHVAPSCNTPTLYSPFSAHMLCMFTPLLPDTTVDCPLYSLTPK